MCIILFKTHRYGIEQTEIINFICLNVLCELLRVIKIYILFRFFTLVYNILFHIFWKYFKSFQLTVQLMVVQELCKECWQRFLLRFWCQNGK